MTDISWAPTRRRGRPRASDSAVTRERILCAAQKVFTTYGYEAATFQAIAAEIGLTRPAINNYFASKPDLYAAVACRASNAVLDAIHTAADAHTLAGQVIAFVRIAIRGAGTDPTLASFLVQAAVDAEHLPTKGNEAAALIERFIRAAVGAAEHRGELAGSPDGLTEMLMGTVLGMAFQVGNGLGPGDGERADRMLDQLHTVLAKGLTA